MRVRAVITVAATVLCLATLAFAAWVVSLGPVPLGQDLALSHVVLDRHGKLLRAYATPQGRWRLPATVEDVDPRFFTVLLGYEDRRFYEHVGVDPLALGRAFWQLIERRRIVSGGSTLTMQVARLLEPRQERSFTAKLRQIVRALEIESKLSKTQILNLYLTLAPYGGNLEGIRAASLAYFGKEPRRLTLGEVALLVALPQSPEQRRPDRYPNAAQAARDRVLDRVAGANIIPRDEIARAKAEPVPHGRKPMPFLAPHSADQIVTAEPVQRVHRLTIDAAWQKSLEDLAREAARRLGPFMSVAIVAVDNASGEVRARVASADYFDDRRDGQVDMTRALRSPGSTLKPFIYGLAFEDGFLHPETLIDDRPVRYGTYAPENFDLTFQGTVTVKRALQLSLNVPAIAVLDKVGTSRLAARLTQAGAALVLPQNEAPGLAMGLGGVGITLNDLTMLYTGLARGGEASPLIEEAGKAVTEHRLLDPVAAWQVGHVLLGAPPPDNAPPGRIAFKTGTSYGYRDAWAVGFDGRFTIGVWVGRPDGSPVPGLVGRASAAPILFDAFARSGEAPMPLPPAPKGTLMASTAKLPLPLQRFRPHGLPSDRGEPPRIMFPPDGARLEMARTDSGVEPVAVKIAGGAGRLTVMVDGVPIAASRGHKTVFFQPEGRGFVRLTVMDSRGASDSVMVRMQ